MIERATVQPAAHTTESIMVAAERYDTEGFAGFESPQRRARVDGSRGLRCR